MTGLSHQTAWAHGSVLPDLRESHYGPLCDGRVTLWFTGALPDGATSRPSLTPHLLEQATAHTSPWNGRNWWSGPGPGLLWLHYSLLRPRTARVPAAELGTGEGGQSSPRQPERPREGDATLSPAASPACHSDSLRVPSQSAQATRSMPRTGAQTAHIHFPRFWRPELPEPAWQVWQDASCLARTLPVWQDTSCLPTAAFWLRSHMQSGVSPPVCLLIRALMPS